MRFIGSKSLLLDNINQVIKDNIKEKVYSFCDIFAGTGVVSRYFKQYYEVYSNDLMYFSYMLQRAVIENDSIPDFRRLKAAGIEDAIFYLENYDLRDINFEDPKYFVSNNYAPSKTSNRMYMTKENANRIDFIRLKLNEWKENKLIDDNEFSYLLACLIEGVPYISNISGTYGAYFKTWDKRALGNFQMKRLDVISNNKNNKSFNKDANELIKEISGDILYIDPPYNSRQYIPNYHVLETICKYDYPEVYGVTGLRDYSMERSSYCNKKEVKEAFEALIKNAEFKYIIVSYSTDGLMSEDDIESILKSYGKESTYKLYKIPYRKYKSKHKQKTVELSELLFFIEKDIELPSKRLKKGSKVKESRVKKYEGSRKEKYIKSPLNYVGGKYKILDQIMPLFPSSINTFVDLFAGGFNVGINAKADKIICNDYNFFIIDLFKEFKNKDTEDIVKHIEGRIEQFKLSKSNEEGFKKFRDFYNKNKQPLDLYTLVCYSFNYQFRFNNNLEYNNPFGRERSQFSQVLKNNLIRFVEEIHKKNIEFCCQDFINIDLNKFDSKDFIYCDPPYLIATGSYNDGNRGFKNWDEAEELKLLSYLDEADKRGVRFALSNVMEHKGKSNDIVKKWSERYNIHYLKRDYSNSSYNTARGDSIEVLITNY